MMGLISRSTTRSWQTEAVVGMSGSGMPHPRPSTPTVAGADQTPWGALPRFVPLSYTWNQAQGIDSIYSYGSCPGYGGTHCINLNDANYGNSGQWANVVALTFYSWNLSNYNFIDGKAYIEYNDYPRGLNAAGYRQTTCQEQGHSLGMGHNGATNSCMYAYIINNNSALYPDSNDFSQIASVYSVAH